MAEAPTTHQPATASLARGLRWAFYLAVGLLWAGCSVGRDYQEPALATPGRYPAGSPAGSVGLTRWWTSFGDVGIDDLVVRGLAANHQRRLALARLAEARANVGLAEAAFGPTVGAGASLDRAATSRYGFLPPQPATNLWQAGFDSNWELDLWGAVRRSREGALAAVEAQAFDVVDIDNTVAAEIVRTVCELRSLAVRRRLADELARSVANGRDLMRQRLGAGLAAGTDLAQAEAATARAAAARPPLQAAEARARHRLAALLGLAPEALDHDPAIAGPVPDLPAQLAVGVPADLMRRRPDLRRAERQLAAATAAVGVAEADLYPRLSLSGAFGVQSTASERLSERAATFWSVGPAVRWNLLDWGRVRASIRAADARVDQALIRCEAALLGAEQEVADDLAALTEDRRQQTGLERARDEAERGLVLARNLRERGLADDLAVAAREQARLAAEDQCETVRLAVAMDTIALAKALGGGWDAALAPLPSPSLAPTAAERIQP